VNPEDDVLPLLDGSRILMAWLVGSFVVTFLITRFVTKMIASGRGPFRNVSFGGVHVHHQVYGIFLMIGSGTLELNYRPGSPWVEMLAVAFGAGAALTLDEFALWLRLDDVYWAKEGRKSVDAVMMAAVVGGLLLVGFNPLNDDAGEGALVVAVNIVTNLLFALLAILKGRTILGVLGVFVPVLALVATVRLAKPTSPWARRFYKEGSRKRQRSLRRFPPGRRSRVDAFVDLFAKPPSPRPIAIPAPGPVTEPDSEPGTGADAVTGAPAPHRGGPAAP
jgi:hypothetical protein